MQQLHMPTNQLLASETAAAQHKAAVQKAPEGIVACEQQVAAQHHGARDCCGNR